jgi:hypothetical protein
VTTGAQAVLQTSQKVVSTPTEGKDVRIHPAQVSSTTTDVAAFSAATRDRFQLDAIQRNEMMQCMKKCANKLLRRILKPKRENVRDEWRNCIMRTFISVDFISIIGVINARIKN